jgi:hypothetical protein
LDPRSHHLSCPGCGSKQPEKLVLVFREVKFGSFLQDSVECPFSGECLYAGSVSCRVCHRKITMVNYHLSKMTKEVLRSMTSG